MIELLNYYGRNKYYDDKSVESVLSYVAKWGDTNRAPYNYGVMCSGDYRKAIIEFQRIQSLFRKTPAMKVRHFAISPEYMYEPEELVLWVLKLGNYLGGYYQTFFSVHVDSKRNHIHFVLNPISYEDGKGFYSNNNTDLFFKRCIEQITGQEVRVILKNVDQ